MSPQDYQGVVEAFMYDRSNPFLQDHPLQPPMQGYRSFKPLGPRSDLVLIYKEALDKYVFYDIGTHNEVYQNKGFS